MLLCILTVGILHILYFCKDFFEILVTYNKDYGCYFLESLSEFGKINLLTLSFENVIS